MTEKKADQPHTDEDMKPIREVISLMQEKENRKIYSPKIWKLFKRAIAALSPRK